MTCNININLNIEVTDQDIDDIMDTALNGITYWCDCAEVVGGYLGKYASDQISRNGILRLHLIEPIDDGVTYYDLTKTKFMAGLKMYLEDDHSECIYFEGSCIKLEPGMIDADAADCIIQLALFDDLVFS